MNFMPKDLFIDTVSETETLKKLKWENRLILIFENPKSENQINEFNKSISEFNERGIKIFFVEKSNTKKFTGHYKCLVEHPVLILIGKDGTLKFETDELVDSKSIYDIIDKMPMRQQEMKRN